MFILGGRQQKIAITLTGVKTQKIGIGIIFPPMFLAYVYSDQTWNFNIFPSHFHVHE